MTKWYKVNINYLWNETDTAAIEVSRPAGGDLFTAKKTYEQEVNKNLYCVDDKSKPAKIELVEYCYNPQTDKTQTSVICRNFEEVKQ